MNFAKIFGSSVMAVALFASFAQAETGTSAQTLTVGSYRSLPQCDGTVEITRSIEGDGSGEQVNVVFRNVKQCSNFDIVSIASGMIDPEFSNKKLQGPQGNKGGSFTISKKLLGSGYNDLQLVVRSNSKKTQDYLNLVFAAVKVQTPSGKTDVIVVPSTSGGY